MTSKTIENDWTSVQRSDKKLNFLLSSEAQQSSAITRSQLRSFDPLGQQRVAGAIPDLRPSLDTERTTLITGQALEMLLFDLLFRCSAPPSLFSCPPSWIFFLEEILPEAIVDHSLITINDGVHYFKYPHWEYFPLLFFLHDFLPTFC